MTAPRFLSILCLGLAVSVAVSQNTAPTDVAEPTRENMMAVTFSIHNLVYGRASYGDIEDIVNIMMSEAGGEMESMEVIDGSPCVQVFLEWRNAARDVIMGLFRRLTTSGFEANGKKFVIGFEGCKLIDCSYGWHKNDRDSVCIKVVNNVNKNFNGARTSCQREGGDLVTMVKDSTQNNFVKGLSKRRTRYWIGINKSKREKHYTFVDGSPLGPFDAFRRGKRNKDKKKARCVLMKNGKWFGRSCKGKRNFVCQKDLY